MSDSTKQTDLSHSQPNSQGRPTATPTDAIERALADLHILQTTLERTLEQQGRMKLPLKPDQMYPKRNIFGRIRGRFWTPSSPSVFTSDALRKLSKGGQRPSHLLNVVAVTLSNLTMIAAIGVSLVIFLLTIIGKITGYTLFPGLNEGERAMVAICTGLLSVTLAALLAEHRLFRTLRDESSSILQLNEMDDRYAQMARDGIAYYGAIVKNVRHRPRLGRGTSTGEYYRRVAVSELGAHREMLRRLSQGTYSAPESHVDQMLDSVLDSVRTYAAVSHRDTDYWRSHNPSTRKYRSHLDTAARKDKVMRIFVASLSDLRDRWEEYLEVLDDQEATHVRWALAIEDRFDPSLATLWNSDIAPELSQVRPETYDFALVNGGEVATFFTHDFHRGDRHLLAAFNVPARERTVHACGSMYIRLLSEVWIGSVEFGAEWRRFLPSVMEARLKAEMGPRGTPEKFVRGLDRQWKTKRLERLKDPRRNELVRRMDIDPQMAIAHCRPGQAPFEVVRSPGDSLVKDMEEFRAILKADVFASMRLDEVEALCTKEEAAKYRRVARELGIKPTWGDLEQQQDLPSPS
jgi:hypothetical protein